MKFFRTKYGTIVNENNIVIPMEEGNALYIEYFTFLQNEGVILETDYVTENELLELELLNKKELHKKLSETDWYVTRFVETGKPIPQDILDLRQKIRNNYQ
jgi:Tfp pilus assembly protein PilZ